MKLHLTHDRQLTFVEDDGTVLYHAENASILEADGAAIPPLPLNVDSAILDATTGSLTCWDEKQNGVEGREWPEGIAVIEKLPALIAARDKRASIAAEQRRADSRVFCKEIVKDTQDVPQLTEVIIL